MTYSTFHKEPENPFKIAAIIIFIILAAWVLINVTACSPQKKLNRLLAKHPELTIENKVTITDTLYLTNTQIDSVFSSSVDSIFISNDSIQIKYIKVKDKIYLSGKTVFKPIIRERIVNVKSPVITVIDPITQHKLNKWRRLCLITWFIISLAICFFVFKKAVASYLKTLPF